jgi:hypothetical protein
MVKFLVKKGAYVSDIVDFANCVHFDNSERAAMDSGEHRDKRQVQIYSFLKECFPLVFIGDKRRELDVLLAGRDTKNMTFADVVELDFYADVVLEQKDYILHLLDVHSIKLHDGSDEMHVQNVSFVKRMVKYGIITPELKELVRFSADKPKILSQLLLTVLG